MKLQLDKLSEEASLLFPRLVELKQSLSCPVVLIDGRSGSGKSTFASLLANLIFQQERQSPKVIQMDDLFEGWDGLEAGSLYLTEQILKPLRANGRAEWQRWDWERGCRGGSDAGNGWRSFDGQNLVIVEGCGSITQSTKEISDFSVWIESDTSRRKERFLARDSGRFADHWASWSSQEEVFYAASRSDQLADKVIRN